MGKLLERIRSLLHDRRHTNAPTEQERRGRKTTLKDADEGLREAVEKLERTARMRRDDFYDHMK